MSWYLYAYTYKISQYYTVMLSLLKMKRSKLLVLILSLLLVSQIIMEFLPEKGSLLLAVSVNVLLLALQVPTFLWYYSLGVSLHSKLPDDVRLNLKHFKLLYSFFLGYYFLFGVYVTSVTMGVSLGLSEALERGLFTLIVVVHLFCIYSVIYVMNFIAKALKAVELRRDVVFSDFSRDFFLLLFHVIGMWFIQPRVNKVFKKQGDV